ncbi:siderophore-interacting protein [Brachybacterium saurashtrense]|uniref:Siderophore-interacting protein n=1 Tax=Brachybacterium saurashtrense TaxID=556288 RepID=A0A345YJT5_9MICO|nr:siderophore-interacting protein [Brachybacterium saurashtrense]AXK44187.1 siderophore-interacting protein [Brachybacterium saurashtrense]RRR21459.1 siderophore-interacting protein [Brachybacterium saurashtrense]
MTGDAPEPVVGRPWEYSAFPVAVARTRRLSPGFLRITLTGPALRNFAPWALDQRIKLVLPMADGSRPEFGLREDPTPHPRQWYTRWKELPEAHRNVLRTYTPSAIRPESAEIDVDLFLHDPPGPASAWALGCAPGDELVITGPDVRCGFTGYGLHYRPPVSPTHLLLIGDESALPALANIVAALPAGTPADVLLELADPRDDILPTAPAEVEVQIVPGGPRAGESLERAVRDWAAHHGAAFVGAPGSYAWIAGEATATVRIRRLLTGDLALPKDRVAFLGYWKHGGPLVG